MNDDLAEAVQLARLDTIRALLEQVQRTGEPLDSEALTAMIGRDEENKSDLDGALRHVADAFVLVVTLVADRDGRNRVETADEAIRDAVARLSENGGLVEREGGSRDAVLDFKTVAREAGGVTGFLYNGPDDLDPVCLLSARLPSEGVDVMGLELYLPDSVLRIMLSFADVQKLIDEPVQIDPDDPWG